MTIEKIGRGDASYSSTSGTRTESGITATGTFYTLTAALEKYPRYVWDERWTAEYEHYSSWVTEDEEGQREYHESAKEVLTQTLSGSPCEWDFSDNVCLMTGRIEGYAPAIELTEYITLRKVTIEFTAYSTDSLLYDNTSSGTGCLIYNGDGALVYGGISSSS